MNSAIPGDGLGEVSRVRACRADARRRHLAAVLGSALLLCCEPTWMRAGSAPTSGTRSATAPVSPATAAGSSSPALLPNAPEDDETEWRFFGRLGLAASYDDNITIRPANEIGDYVFHVAPSLAFGIGNFRTAIAPYAAIPHILARTGEEDLPRRDYAFASYTPDAVFFREHDSENTVNHDVRLAARRERDLWSSQGELRLQRLTDVDLDAGRRVRQTYYTASSSFERSLTGKVLGGLGARGYRAEYAGGNTSTDLRGNGFLDYQIAPKTSIGFGVVAGYLMVDNGADQTYQQPLVQLKYRATEKISFLAQAGEEFRQYDSDIDDRSRFVFSLSGNYAASEATAFSLSARRETHSSPQFSGENVVATLYQAGVRQRILQRIYLSLLGGHVRNDYEHNVPSAVLSRRDNFYFYKATTSADITRHGTIELSYEHRQNDSTLPTFEFDQNVFTLSAGFLF